jgi:hypothetical protein
VECVPICARRDVSSVATQSLACDADSNPPVFVQATAMFVCLSTVLAFQISSRGLLLLRQVGPVTGPTSVKLGFVGVLKCRQRRSILQRALAESRFSCVEHMLRQAARHGRSIVVQRAECSPRGWVTLSDRSGSISDSNFDGGAQCRSRSKVGAFTSIDPMCTTDGA